MTSLSSAERPSNELKFETANPLVRAMIGNFFSRLREVVAPLEPTSTLDAGCGEGETLVRLGSVLGERIAAVDLSAYSVGRVGERLPGVDARVASVTDLPFRDASFDLVLCLEVLEHLDDPAAAVRELARVATSDVVVSVPLEPWFRIGSLLRGKHVRALGNHPEHVNHFNRRSLAAMLGTALDIETIRTAFPWLIAHGRPRAAG
ncbi:MAG: class I SAM-dependent methyltransferase [Solirubrobacterales bacterium]